MSRTAAMSAALARNWWAIGLRALLAVAFVIAVLLLPRPTLGALVLMFAAYMAADGALEIVSGLRAMRRGEFWQTLIFEGATNLALVGAVLIWPAMAAVAFVRLTSAWAIVTGALLVAAARRLSPSTAAGCLRLLASYLVSGARWWPPWDRLPAAYLGLVADRLLAAICSDSPGPRRPPTKAA